MNPKEKYSAGAAWSTVYTESNSIAYPAEHVIRIFKGNYPNLTMPKTKKGESILDAGCGDGRHLPFFKQLGLEVHGVEISDSIVTKLKDNLSPLGINPDNLHTGSCSHLPFNDASFDYVIGWNSVYYMSLDDAKFEAHAAELLRVLRPGGWLILSVPKPTAFIFKGSDPASLPGYRIIRNDPFGGLRNNEVMKVFESHDELISYFEPECDQFCKGDIHGDCFGLDYHWFLLVAHKRES